MPRVSIIIPTINEEKSIGETIDKVRSSLRGHNYEIIIVDTNSVDKTTEIAKKKGARIVNEPKRGYGRAYKTAFAHIKGDIIVTLDADATYPPESIPTLLKLLEKADFVSGQRIAGKTMTLIHRFGNWVITKTTNTFFGTSFKDSQSGMWAFKKSILKNLKLANNSWPFSGEIKIEAVIRGYKFKEYPIKYRLRKGSSKVRSWSVGLENIKFLFWKLVHK